MRKKIMTILIAVAFTCSVLFLMTSCAKKQIAGEEGITAPAAPAAPATPSAKPGIEEKVSDADADRRAREAAKAAAQAKLKKEIQTFESGNIYFDYDRSELKPKAQDVLTKKANWLKKNGRYSVRIEGHCDERGTNEYNLALGERRANAAKKFLQALGISGNRLTTRSYGEEKPAAYGHDESAWSKNRRDEFKLIK
ncbi:MAG: peptidoglycan-associated lipoprotein Pal [Deltaproteobacteria bacterium]|nr:peptidoglycan-associated lipoprotein Pal [Deltaproteobacteria bacterium]